MSQLTKGESRSFTLTLRSRRSDNTVGDPIDLTGKTISVKYKNESGTQEVLSASVLDAKLGKVTVPFTTAQSSTLKVGDFKFDVYIIEGSSDPLIYPIEGKITVKSRNA